MLHPHVGTMIENTAEVQRVLEGSSIALCLDTGHLLIGGTDPAELTRQAPDRIAHVHFKDVDARKAKNVQDGRWTYTEGVTRGMYRPLGTGDVDVAAIVAHLTKRGYDGWYTLEQDTILEERRRAKARSPTSGPAPTTCAPCCGARDDRRRRRHDQGHCGSESSVRRASPNWRSSSPHTPPAPGSSRWRPGTGGAPRLSPPNTASSGRRDSYADVLADPEVEVVYNPLPNAIHGPWNLAASPPASTSSPRSRSPPPPTRRPRSAPPHKPPG